MRIFPIYLWFWEHEGFHWMRINKKMSLTVFEKANKKKRPDKPWVLRYVNRLKGDPLEKGEDNYATFEEAIKAGNKLIRKTR